MASPGCLLPHSNMNSASPLPLVALLSNTASYGPSLSAWTRSSKGHLGFVIWADRIKLPVPVWICTLLMASGVLLFTRCLFTLFGGYRIRPSPNFVPFCRIMEIEFRISQLGVVACAFNSSAHKTEAGKTLLNLRPD